MNRRTGDERRKGKYSGSQLGLLPAFTAPFERLAVLGIRIWIPLRDSSGFSPDSMPLPWLVGERLPVCGGC